MSRVKKLDFTEEQKKEYRKLRMIIVFIGIPGLVTVIVLRLLGFVQISNLAISLLLLFLCFYVYSTYRRILSKGKSTTVYAEFQKEIYGKALKLFGLFLIPYSFLVVYLVVFQTELLAQNPVLIFLLLLAPGIIFGIWAMLYELKRFGALMRAP